MGDLSYSEPPGGLTEREVLDALTVEEKATIARTSTMEFPHLSRGMVIEWIEEHGGDPSGGRPMGTAGLPLSALVDELVGLLEQQANRGDHEPIESFCHGCLYEANLHFLLDAEPDEIVERARGGGR